MKCDLDPHSSLYSINGKTKKNRGGYDDSDDSKPLQDNNGNSGFSRRILSHEDFKDPHRILNEQTIHNETEKYIIIIIY